VGDDETLKHEAVLCANSCLSILKTVLSHTRCHSILLYDCLEAIEMCTATLKTEAVEGDANRDAGHLSRIAEETLRTVKKWLKQVLHDQVPCYTDSAKREELTVWTCFICSPITFTGSKFHENNKPNFSQFDASLLQESLHQNNLQFREELLPLTYPSLNIKAKTYV